MIELPPHELRGPLGQLGDAAGGIVPALAPMPVPSALAGASPGLAAAAAAPPPIAPTMSAEDPGDLARLLGDGAGPAVLPTSIAPLSLAGGVPVPPPGGVPAGGAPAGVVPAGVPAGGVPLGGVPVGGVPLGGVPLGGVPVNPFGHDVPLDLSGVLGEPGESMRLPLLDGGIAPAFPDGPGHVPTDDEAAWRAGVADPRQTRADRPDEGAPAATRFELPHQHHTDVVAPAHDAGAFDPYATRREFPILDQRVNGKPLVWLDNAATTQKPQAVIDRLSWFYSHENSNVHRAAHTLAARATDAYEGARETTRKFLGAPSAKDIVFVRGATEGINLIAQSWGRRNVGEGDEIVLTQLEHHANIVPWQQLCTATGARLRVAPVDDRGDVILEDYERLLGPRTKLVSFTQVSNALGTVTPARDMVAIAHRYGACVVVDGAQAVSHMPVDVQALDCDFYVFSGHKVFAPTGIGAVYGKRAILDAMPPWQGGGNMIADVTFERTTYQAPPWRFEAGTGNIADAAGLGTALEYVMRIGMPVIERYEHELLVYATDRLATVPGLRMIGTSRTKAGVMSFVLDGHRTEELGAALDQEGIAVRSGHHCAQPILRRFGLEATVRASLAFYNVREDIDALVAALHRLARGAPDGLHR